MVAAAREAFADNGSRASMKDVARRSGVSIATLYRNFPTREDLVAEVHRDEVEQLCPAASGLDGLEPWDALVTCRKALRDAGAPLLEAQRLRGAAVSRT
nr:TetR/AcrR family transcriptional regulator [Amycolatopsis lexingtonensis]